MESMQVFEEWQLKEAMARYRPPNEGFLVTSRRVSM
jgi:hypothetical protein